MKKTRRILLVLLLLVVVGALAVYMNLNRIVRRTIEVKATDSLTLQTKLGGARLALFGGTLSLDDLTIASPEGYAAEHMLALDDGSVRVSYGQLRNDPVRIQSITLTKPRLVVEHANGKFNFQVLSDKQSQTPPDSGAPADGERQEAEPIRVVIDHLRIEDAIVVLRPGLPGLSQEITANIPTFELHDVGSGEGNRNGAAIKDVVLEIITAMAAKTDAANVPEQLRNQLRQSAEQVAQQVSAQARQKVDALTGRLDESLKGTGLDVNVGETVDKKLTNILGSDKEDDEAAGKKQDRPRKRDR